MMSFLFTFELPDAFGCRPSNLDWSLSSGRQLTDILLDKLITVATLILNPPVQLHFI